MNCPTCHAPIEDGLISCRACAERKSRAMVLEQQKEFLPEILTSVRELTLTRPASERRWHILLAGVRAHTFCDLVAHPSWRRRRTTYAEMAYIGICPGCHDTLEGLVKETDSAEVR
jgi:hypothetical protein